VPRSLRFLQGAGDGADGAAAGFVRHIIRPVSLT